MEKTGLRLPEDTEYFHVGWDESGTVADLTSRLRFLAEGKWGKGCAWSFIIHHDDDTATVFRGEERVAKDFWAVKRRTTVHPTSDEEFCALSGISSTVLETIRSYIADGGLSMPTLGEPLIQRCDLCVGWGRFDDIECPRCGGTGKG